METHNASKRTAPSIGLAYSAHVPRILEKHRALLDFIEVPFELLEHDPHVLDALVDIPIVLHCASLSIASVHRPETQVLSAVNKWLNYTNSPWLGEHLSFISENLPEGIGKADEYAPNEPYNLGYTLSPPMNLESVQVVVSAIAEARTIIDRPIILENPPLYFVPPTTVLSQVEFINAIASESDIGLLLDISHLLITRQNVGDERLGNLNDYPFQLVREIHLSGATRDSGILWDNHAAHMSEEAWNLFRYVLGRCQPSAVTLEYNWAAAFPVDAILGELQQARSILGLS